MAKRKDDDLPEFDDDSVAQAAEEADEVAEEAAEDVDVDVDVVDVDEASESDIADVPESLADDDDAGDGPADDDSRAGEPPDDDAEPVVAAAPRKKPKVTGLTLTLIILNVLAALGFLVLLMMTFEKRQGYAFFGWAQEWFLAGPGTQEDRTGVTAAVSLMPRPVLSNEALKEAHSKRPGTTSSPEPFTQVEQGFHYHLYRGDLTPDMLRELMSDLGEPVGSVEEEMARLKTKLLPQIDGLGAEILKVTEKMPEPAKQDRVLQLLFPLCKNTLQVTDLEKRVKAMTGDALAKTLQEAVQRRVLADILWPAEMYRPSDPERAVLERAADLDLKLDDLRDLLTRRLNAATKDKYDGSVHFGKEWDGQTRGTVEKRQNAAFLLVSVALAYKHVDPRAKLEDQWLEPKGLERAQRISGLFDFTQACVNYNDAIRRLETRVLEALALDREGFRIAVNNDVKGSATFAEKHAALLFQIRQVQLQIRQAEARVEDLKQQLSRSDELVKDRTKHSAEVAKRILEERVITAERNADLQRMQQQLFRALAELATAAETNDLLERRIRQRSGLKEAQP